MNLIIVESPTKERTIAKFLNNTTDEEKFIIKSSYGHVRDLPANNLGVDEKNNFRPQYIILPKARKVIAELKKIVKHVKEIYLATDYDREGEAIAWHLVKVLGLDINSVKRITFHEITKPAILYALDHPRKIDLNLVNSQQARRIIDRLVGYKLSPLLWKKITNKLSAGRVQSAALKFIYDREKEIEKFVPEEYWTIECSFYKDGQEKLLNTKLTHINNVKLQKLDIKTQQDAQNIVKEVKDYGIGKVVQIETEEKFKSPPEPYITSTLQQDASWKLKFSPSKTMLIAQSLYEGVDLGDKERVGLITYMRTDSAFVSDYAIEELRKFITEKIGVEYLNDKVRKFKSKVKNAQEAHEAIRPTSVYRTPEEIKQYLSEDQYKLYKLIWERFVATQMKDIKYKNINIAVNVGNKYLFETEFKEILFDGYTKILAEEQKDKNEFLQGVNVDDLLKIKDCIGKQHFTEPPPRYTEASLIKELEKNGIGRPSTYATIVDTLKIRGYVKLKDRKFYITPLGKEVTELLSKYFSEIVDKSYTAKVEELLDKISEGKEDWVRVISLFYNPLIKNLKKAFEEIKSKNEIVKDQKCKLCGGTLVIRTSKYGKFVACSNYPKCKYKVSEYEKRKTETKS
ncbi:MAG: type I DNA topoisomerase [Endomicrobia bacterium]|nr:type I DNA topoisomerase [Endomicrobiia bacterium]MDW8055194.1 type I DNA topoisomerase [Elusimicrobiota bacterium]